MWSTNYSCLASFYIGLMPPNRNNGGGVGRWHSHISSNCVSTEKRRPLPTRNQHRDGGRRWRKGATGRAWHGVDRVANLDASSARIQEILR